MNRNLALVIIFVVFLGMLALAFEVQQVKAEPETWTVDDDGPADFHTIQEAINSSNPGDIVFVKNGAYYGNVVVNKAISLVGESRELTTVDASGGVSVNADNVTIRGFNIRNGHDTGFYLNGVKNVIIKDNDIFSNGYVQVSGSSWVGAGTGIWVGNSFSIRIEGNNIVSNYFDGILITSSGKVTIQQNVILNNCMGYPLIPESLRLPFAYTYSGINIHYPSSSYGDIEHEVTQNILSNKTGSGIILNQCYNGKVRINGNTIIDNQEAGIYMKWSKDNTICHNNFLNNTKQVVVYTAYTAYPNTWNDGYPSGGNYWSDYNETDANLDGIGDNPYIIDANNTDHYPLVNQYVIPEFPSFLVLPLFIVATLLPVIVHRKSGIKNRKTNSDEAT
jgi:parallel beta-helix repeat protein